MIKMHPQLTRCYSDITQGMLLGNKQVLIVFERLILTAIDVQRLTYGSKFPKIKAKLLHSLLLFNHLLFALKLHNNTLSYVFGFFSVAQPQVNCCSVNT